MFNYSKKTFHFLYFLLSRCSIGSCWSFQRCSIIPKTFHFLYSFTFHVFYWKLLRLSRYFNDSIMFQLSIAFIILKWKLMVFFMVFWFILLIRVSVSYSFQYVSNGGMCHLIIYCPSSLVFFFHYLELFKSLLSLLHSCYCSYFYYPQRIKKDIKRQHVIINLV